MKNTIIVIGGGAAGFFGAINIAEKNPELDVILLEKARALLSKVRISGGGRCNVTHSCFDPNLLVKHYPRGEKALLGPFHKFQPQDTIQWFKNKGVILKTEADGRMFPASNSSETIVHCFLQAAAKAKVSIRPEVSVSSIKKIEDGFEIETSSGDILVCNKLLIATGSVTKMHSLLEELGHTIVPAVPSLFTFTIQDPKLLELSGVSVPKAHLKFEGIKFEQTGPLLITHWGLSGPAALKLSAWAARDLFEKDYKATLYVNWTSEKEEKIKEALLQMKKEKAALQINKDPFLQIPKSLWKMLLEKACVAEDKVWSTLSNKEIQILSQLLTKSAYQVNGKSTYKEEFVTAGGLNLKEVDFRTMESKVVPGLYFAGEVLDIDGVTGGFNFQNAWTTAWIASEAISQ